MGAYSKLQNNRGYPVYYAGLFVFFINLLKYDTELENKSLYDQLTKYISGNDLNSLLPNPNDFSNKDEYKYEIFKTIKIPLKYKEHGDKYLYVLQYL